MAGQRTNVRCHPGSGPEPADPLSLVSADCVEKPSFGGAIAWFVMKGDVVVAALGPLDRGRQLRHWDELGELPEVLNGGGEEELVPCAPGTS